VKNDGVKKSIRNGTTGMAEATNPETIEDMVNHFFATMPLAYLAILISEWVD
jgi:hypothetical protein